MEYNGRNNDIMNSEIERLIYLYELFDRYLKSGPRKLFHIIWYSITSKKKECI